MIAGSDRDLLLDRVRQAVRSGNAHRAPALELPAAVGYFGAGPDPTAQLVEELRKAGAQPCLVHSAREAQETLAALLRRFTAHRAIVNADPLLDELGLIDCLRAAGVALVTSAELARSDESERRHHLFAADLGLAAPDWAIAETGSLVYLTSATQVRSTSLLPPVHVAVVDSRRILPDLFDLPGQLGRAADGSLVAANVVLVTGPSKTGDIELRLTTGVHGPGDLHVLVWQRPTE